MKTIVAISTPYGSGGVGIVRLSGGEALAIAGALFFVKGKRVKPEAVKHAQMLFGETRTNELADLGYMVYFKAPRSFTGEDVVEFHAHGGPRILTSIVKRCIELGAAAAAPGEFTKRAFISGKLSLAAAEGIVDMINAESAAAVRAAYSMAGGELIKRVKSLQNALADTITNLEAVLDFPEETADYEIPAAEGAISKIKYGIDRLIASADTGRIAKEGITAAVTGRPNVGKSSLFNKILLKERAIVSEIPGTTRDLLSESFEYKGVKINLTDGAGIRETEDKIEKIGVLYAKNALLSADFVIYVEDDAALLCGAESVISDTKKLFKVLNKCDLSGENYGFNDGVFRVSARTGGGITELLDALTADFLKGETAAGKEVVSSLRHLTALKAASEALGDAMTGYRDNTADCVLIDLRSAYFSLGEITGETASEKIIEDIFSKFCIGK
ncbi:MAG TPA: tRNA uridine-5-carboxymethylaminomethyl(34) synthesis GTPase MnmE [Clostridia bacterium]|nr:tRNA uridine-5-carboxymethylaminomethyl(34) synthesis GTPase MnmE [Clostridia bacterium]HRU84035.1 tRNA uridine-5-carboxymethylaminomethyl(34) synthesis GTPase MnmE [Eubacteriales bacterium]